MILFVGFSFAPVVWVLASVLRSVSSYWCFFALVAFCIISSLLARAIFSVQHLCSLLARVACWLHIFYRLSSATAGDCCSDAPCAGKPVLFLCTVRQNPCIVLLLSAPPIVLCSAAILCYSTSNCALFCHSPLLLDQRLCTATSRAWSATGAGTGSSLASMTSICFLHWSWFKSLQPVPSWAIICLFFGCCCINRVCWDGGKGCLYGIDCSKGW